MIFMFVSWGIGDSVLEKLYHEFTIETIVGIQGIESRRPVIESILAGYRIETMAGIQCIESLANGPNKK